MHLFAEEVAEEWSDAEERSEESDAEEEESEEEGNEEDAAQPQSTQTPAATQAESGGVATENQSGLLGRSALNIFRAECKAKPGPKRSDADVRKLFDARDDDERARLNQLSEASKKAAALARKQASGDTGTTPAIDSERA